MNAADVLADLMKDHWDTTNVPDDSEGLVAALLAHGELGVAILPDGTLWALVPNVLAADCTLLPEAEADSIFYAGLYRLVPLSAEAGDTDAIGGWDQHTPLPGDP